MGRIEVTDHDHFIFGDLTQHLSIQLGVLPHLEDVDDLSDVHARALHDTLKDLGVDFKLLISANLLDSF